MTDLETESRTWKGAISIGREKTKTESLSMREFFALLHRTWPYLRSQLVHLLVWVGLRMAIELIWVSAMLVTYDLFNNKILVGEKLESTQAALLFLDDSFVYSERELELREAIRELDESAADEDSEDAPVPTTDTDERGTLEAQISRLNEEQRKTVRNRFFVVIAIAGVLIFMLAPVVDYYRTWILQRINQYLRVTMIERAEHLSLRYHTHARTGDAIYRVYQDSAMITNIVEKILLEPSIAIFTSVFSFIVIVTFSLTLGIMFFIGVMPIVLLVAWFTPRIQLRSRAARTTNSELTSRIQEAFQSIRIVKANKALKVMESRFNHDSFAALDAALLLRGEVLLMRMLVALMIGAWIIAAEFLMASWVLEERATFLFGYVALVGFAAWNYGAFLAARGRVTEFLWNGNDLIRVWSVLQDMVVGLERAFFLLDLKPEIVDKSDAIEMPTEIESVSFEAVRFGYDPEQPVLNGLNLTAQKGTVTAIVGKTGSGKSTLMSLLLRLYDVDDGRILVNDHLLSEIKINSLRSNIAIALQQNNLFAATIADNIAYAQKDVSREQIIEASKIACADEFISELRDGYDTELGERGGKLSTGQKQRLSIARAIVRDTPILILDEPTSALDAETEHKVLRNLASWAQDRIIFLITHRYSTIQNADQIALIENGTIVESGSHESLMAISEGRYRKFFSVELDAVSEH